MKRGGKAQQIACYLINRAFEKNKKIENLRLQQILYFIQVEAQKALGHPLFFEEMRTSLVGAWVKNVYDQYAGCGVMDIRRAVFEPYAEECIPELTAKEKLIVNQVFDKYIDQPIWDPLKEEREEGQPYSRYYVEGEYFQIKDFRITQIMNKSTRRKRSIWNRFRNLI